MKKALLLIGFSAVVAVSGAQSQPPYAPGELIVKFTGKAPAFSTLANQFLGAKTLETLGTQELQRVKLPPMTSLSSAVSYYKAMGAEYAEPNYRISIALSPNDPYFESQYGVSQIQCPPAWDLTLGSTSVVVAIVDTGIDLRHPDLAEKIVAGIDLVNNDNSPDDDNGHGTHCAGIAAAATNNAIGVAGVAPNCKVMPVKVLDSRGDGYTSTVARGMRYAADGGAKVISLSLGMPARSQALQDAVNYALSKGAIVVAAAGNEGASAKFYPAACNGVISVGAVDANGNKAHFSNYGPWVSVAAPGVRILSTWPGGAYAYGSGTSMAAPFVAGQAAMLYSFFGTNKLPAEIREKIEANCVPSGTWVVHGRVNLLASLTGPDNGGDDSSPSRIVPNALTFSRGQIVQGNIEDLGVSDDKPLVMQSAGSLTRVLDASGTFPVGVNAQPGSLELVLEASTNVPGTVSVYAYQFPRRRWVKIGNVSLTGSDQVFAGPLSNLNARCVNAAGEMRFRLYRSARSRVPINTSLDVFCVVKK